MATLDAGPIAARVPGGHQLVTGRASHTLTAPLRRAGVAVDATASVARLYNAQGGLVKEADPALVGTVPTLTVLEADLVDQVRGVGWRVEWDVTHADGEERFQLGCSYVRRELRPVIDLQDIWRRHKMLNPDGVHPATKQTKDQQQDLLDDAWGIVITRLEASGQRPDLVMSSEALREVHLTKSLELILDDAAGQTGEQFMERAMMYASKFEAAWDRLGFTVDRDDDGVPDNGGKRTAPPSHVWLT